jgi:hypothetical protein
VSDIDYDLLRGQVGGDPPDGLHSAYLMRAALVNTSSGTRLVTEWQTSGDESYYWTTWFGFDGNRLGFTQDFLDGLGVDRSKVTDDDAFEQTLADVQGTVYTVRTAAWSGGVNTYVEETPAPPPGQTSFGDVPIDMPAQEAVAAASQTSDDDIPF